MTIITDGPNKLWTSGSTTAMTVRKSRKATKIVYNCYGRDNIIIRDYHLQRHHFRETNWSIQSIKEIWIIPVFIFKAGTHSTIISQYLSVPAKSGITIITLHTLPVFLNMEWTQNYKWICWMCPSGCMWYQTAAVLGPNPVMVDRSLCRSNLQTIYFSRSLHYGLPKSKLICECYHAAETCL
jgi:hypothetical protein